MITKLVYASGPIAATDYVGATAWYAEAERYLHHGIRLITPMRGKDYIAEHVGVIGRGAARKGEAMPWELSDAGERLARLMATPQAITGRDRYDTQRAHAVLMNLTGCNGRVSIGCMIEAGWADAARVPIVLCAEPGNVHEGHAILETLATYRTDNLQEACEALNSLFEPEVYA